MLTGDRLGLVVAGPAVLQLDQPLVRDQRGPRLVPFLVLDDGGSAALGEPAIVSDYLVIEPDDPWSPPF